MGQCMGFVESGSQAVFVLRRLLGGSLIVPGLFPLVVKANGSCVFPDDEDTGAFITSNVVATFYHELGHALIDVLALREWIDVSMANCGEANAFYHTEKRSITICNECARDLERIWKTQRQGVKETLN